MPREIKPSDEQARAFWEAKDPKPEETGSEYKVRIINEWCAELNDARLDGARLAFRVLHESLLGLAGGAYTAGRIAERLREIGLTEASTSELHPFGLQDIANAIFEAAQPKPKTTVIDLGEALDRSTKR